MTLHEILIAALARVSEWGIGGATAESVMVERVNARTQQLFARMAEVNPDFASIVETAPIDHVDDEDGGGDVVALDALNYDVVRLVEVAICDSGEHAEGTRVAVVPANDLAAGLSPRVIARADALVGVADDLADVDRLRLTYLRCAEEVRADDDEPEIPALFHTLLVVDLARDLTKRAVALPADQRVAILGLFDAEDAELLKDFETYLRSFAPVQRRFTT